MLGLLAADQRAQRAIEPLDDGPRRARRRKQPIVQNRFESWQAGLVCGRHVGQEAEPSGAKNCDRAQRAGLQIAERRRQHAECNRHVIAEEIVHQLRRALEGDDRSVDAGDRLEQFGGEITAGPGRRRADIELGTRSLRNGNHLSDRLGGERGMR